MANRLPQLSGAAKGGTIAGCGCGSCGHFVNWRPLLAALA